MESSVKLSVVTVTFNSEHVIGDYLSSLKRNLPQGSEVIIVDNSSMDKTVSIIEDAAWPKLIKNNSNLGFGAGCNIGASLASGELLLFLNPDTVTKPGAIEKLVDCILTDESIGIVGPRLVDQNGKVQESVTNLPTLKGAFYEFVLGYKNAYLQYAPLGQNNQGVEAIYAAAILLRRVVFEKLHGFSKKYFLYYEDLDLCDRVRKLGLKVVYCPKSEFVHLIGQSGHKIKPLPRFLAIMSHFIPIKQSGTYYFLVKSGYIYHGIVTGFLIRLIIYLSHFGFGKTSVARS